GCIRADIGEPHYSPSKKFSEILKNIIPDEKFEYAPTFGVPKLIEAVKFFEYKKYENFRSPQICITAGAQAGIFSVCNAVLSKGDEILVHKAYYPPYKNIATLCDAKLIDIDFYDIELLESTITKNTKMIIVNSPNNPTGEIFSEEILKKIAQYAQKHNLLILSDDVYDRLLFSENTKNSHISEFAPERTIACNSVSKSLCLTGARIGWILGEKNLISEIAKVHRNINSCPNSTFQSAIADFLPESKEFLDMFSKELEMRAQKISTVFINLGWEFIFPKGGMYIWVKIPFCYNEMSGEEFVSFLIDTVGVSGIPGGMFGKENDEYVRFCFGALRGEEIEELRKRMSNL
ncbi:TPA: pyridoxal phosphate-dependent aminotransferase, partial [Candidatus Peregrinibacteria bacterium]|nr:pyridoxal phosphate-dependent aminotransferase [Candidatus Peregrinibacteria bacterium]